MNELEIALINNQINRYEEDLFNDLKKLDAEKEYHIVKIDIMKKQCVKDYLKVFNELTELRMSEIVKKEKSSE